MTPAARSSMHLRALAAGALLALLVSPAAAAAPFGFAFDVALSPEAVLKLRVNHAVIGVAAQYHGEPIASKKAQADGEDGLIVLGREEVHLAPGEQLHAVLTGGQVNAAHAGWVRELDVTVSVFSVGPGNADNLLSCSDAFMGPLTEAQARPPHRMTCQLASEQRQGDAAPPPPPPSPPPPPPEPTAAAPPSVGRLGAGAGAPEQPIRHSHGAPEIALPNFPWPPAAPSEKMNLPHARIAAGLGARPSLAAVGGRLTGALQAAGYSEYSFFRVPGGFALVARLERFRLDGSPEPQGLRFLDPNAQTPFSLGAYVQHLFFAPEGFYRLIVFVVTDASFVASAPSPNSDVATRWLRTGADTLPPSYDDLKFTNGHQVSALIYEFRKHGQDPIATLEPGRLDARTHLLKSGLFAGLVGGAP